MEVSSNNRDEAGRPVVRQALSERRNGAGKTTEVVPTLVFSKMLSYNGDRYSMFVSCKVRTIKGGAVVLEVKVQANILPSREGFTEEGVISGEMDL